MARFSERADGFGQGPMRRGGLVHDAFASDQTRAPEYPRFHRWMDRQLKRFDAKFAHYRVDVRAAAGRIHRGALTEFEEFSEAEYDRDANFEGPDIDGTEFGGGDFGMGDFGGGGW